jgi:hypothetical protein
MAIKARKPLLFTICGLIAVLNRETGVLLGLLTLPVILNSVFKHRVIWLAASFLPAVGYIVLRLCIGNKPHILTLASIFDENWNNKREAARVLWQYYGSFWILVLVTVYQKKSDFGFISFLILNSISNSRFKEFSSVF